MRTITSLIVAASLAAFGAACKKDRDDTAGVATKPIDDADEAAEKVRDNDLPAAEDTKDALKEANEEVGEARQELAEETAEARKEIGDNFMKLRDELRALSSASTTFVASRDQVAANVRSNIDMLEQRMAKMSARAGTLVGDARNQANEKLNDLTKLATEAKAEAITLGQATAESWEKARDESLDSLGRLHEKVNDVSETIYDAK
jgi:uncharacterized phage infection (PIP) family protein YhgE